MRHAWTISLLSLALAGCSFDRPPPLTGDGGDDDPTVDAMVDMEPVECDPDTIACDDAAGRYVECGSDGVATRVIPCALGCSATAEKCVDIDPSNGLAPYLDVARNDATVPSVAFSGASTIDTSTGEVTNDGVTITIPSQVVGDMRVFILKELRIAGTLKVTGPSHALVFIVDGDVLITGTLDASADRSVPGPGGALMTHACNGSGSGTLMLSNHGAGGAGRYDLGANGGIANAGGAGLSGGSSLRDEDVVPLRAGCWGGSKFENINGQNHATLGGAAGGAIQISSSLRIAITGIGKIDASGGGGTANGDFVIPGAGGGSGGAVLLEAPAIVMDGPGTVVSTKGGGGSAAGTAATRDGSDGGTEAGPAPGGTSPPNAAGGAGGTESAAPVPGANGPSSSNPDGGGGGGSVGEARFNTRDGQLTPMNGGAVRSRFTVGTVAGRLVP